MSALPWPFVTSALATCVRSRSESMGGSFRVGGYDVSARQTEVFGSGTTRRMLPLELYHLRYRPSSIVERASKANAFGCSPTAQGGGHGLLTRALRKAA